MSISQVIVIKNLKGESKMARLKIKPEISTTNLRKPKWIRIKQLNNNKITKLKKIIQNNNLFSVCEEASCPNLNECFNSGTATFMIMGQICTRRCPFCDVAHGKPLPLDNNEPQNLAITIKKMHLKYVVITSVDRDDLRDGGTQHFVNCINTIKQLVPKIKIEILTPDFRGKEKLAINTLSKIAFNVFNHNLETVPDLYPQVRPGADYLHSLQLLKNFKLKNPQIITKSGLMLGIGETQTQVLKVLQDLRANNVDMLTLGQYLSPSKYHLNIVRYLTPKEFDIYKKIALEMGFTQVASAPMVRSSYHADLQIINKSST